ncbi:MAG: hypothetical protein IH598_09970 [Bacteroidales bacterium]|nr:hypothetical protein [Bacteroidales bacterium]
MNQANESFQRDLDELIRLLKKIKANTNDPRFEHLDPILKQNIDFIINNYEMFKNNIPLEMMGQLGLPFQQMVRQFLDIMKSDLGEEYSIDTTTNLQPAIREYQAPKEDPKADPDERVRLIDEMLKRPDLTDDAIDKLLDERNQLLGSR